MHEVTLALPDDVYTELQARAARAGMSLELLLVTRLTAETTAAEKNALEQRLVQEALDASGLLQSVSADLIASCVLEPAAPRRSPVQVPGKPLSAVIIEQRGVLR